MQDEPEEEEPLDEETQAADVQALDRIKQILAEFEEEMNNFEMKKEGESTEFYYFGLFVVIKNKLVESLLM